MSMTPCLDEASILSFGRGDMPASRRATAEAHVAVCDECRVLASAVRRASIVDHGEIAPVAQPASDAVAAPVAAPAPVRIQARAEASVAPSLPVALPVPRPRTTVLVAACAGVALLLLGLVLSFARGH